MKNPILILPPEGTLSPNDLRDDPLRYYYHSIWGGMYRNRIESGLQLLRPPYRRILEIGYGSGIVMPTLCRVGTEVYGVDPVSDPVEVGVNLSKMAITPMLFQADIREWNYTGEKFDLIVSFSVMEHIASPGPVLERVVNWLQPNGTLLIGMPRVGQLMVPLFSLIGYNGINNHHVTSFREVCQHAPRQLKLNTIKTFPSYFPSFAALYYNMLFNKCC